MTKKLTERELKKSAASKKKKRKAQAALDKRITRALDRLEKKAQERIEKLKNSKARGKTLQKQTESVALQVADLVATREAVGRKSAKKGFWETFMSAPATLLADFLSINAPTVSEHIGNAYRVITGGKRTRINYEYYLTIQVCPDMPPMFGKDVDVTPRGVIVANAIRDAQKIIDEYTNRNDVVGIDFAISSVINYPDKKSTMHVSFQDASPVRAHEYFVEKLQGMVNNEYLANVEIVFPINLQIMKRKV